ncbi:lamin tail domain-containing protein [Candidatus Roizmanbacteria bacterium]|nr:lamin tail domain-containing protein [Candidatus Roizmanbacteria bacterium]
MLGIFTQTVCALAPSVRVDSAPTDVVSGSDFTVTFTLVKNSSTTSNFRVKGRIGSSSASLNAGETNNPLSNVWLSDTASWDDFPLVQIDSEGIASSSVKLRSKTTIPAGLYQLVMRVKGDTTYDSAPIAITIETPTLTPTPLVMPTAIPTSTLEVVVTPTPSTTPVPTAGTPAIDYSGIQISECMVNPLAGEFEWIELYNANDESVHLSNWYVDDSADTGSSPHIFSLTLPAYGYSTITLSSSMFNNSSDTVRLLNADRTEKDSFSYSSSEKGISWGRDPLNESSFCRMEPSRSAPNNICFGSSTTPAPTKKLISNSTRTAAKSPEKNTSTPAHFSNSRTQPYSAQIEPEIIAPFEPNGTVLGGTSYRDTTAPSSIAAIQSLLILSFAFSLLSGSSVFYKMMKSS